MSWSIGYDHNWKRDIGYGVPAVCDYPGCNKEIDRGLYHVCGGEPYGGDKGCGLYFCAQHISVTNFCDRCIEQSGLEPYDAKPDTLEWIGWKLSDESWQQWRDENPQEVEAMKRQMGQ